MYFKFKENYAIVSSDLYYDLFIGGYIKPEKFVEDESQLEEIKEAISLVKSFIDEAKEKGVIDLC